MNKNILNLKSISIDIHIPICLFIVIYNQFDSLVQYICSIDIFIILSQLLIQYTLELNSIEFTLNSVKFN